MSRILYELTRVIEFFSALMNLKLIASGFGYFINYAIQIERSKDAKYKADDCDRDIRY